MRTGIPRLLLTLVLALMAMPGLMTVRAQTPAKTVNVELILDFLSDRWPSNWILGKPASMPPSKCLAVCHRRNARKTEGVNVGFRVYGHKGNNTKAGKQGLWRVAVRPNSRSR